ncbi:MAG: S9 family peptidase, partial [Pseudomonadales bacterium]|nr:S9 family peptidase [Pseudomonadales bacterium]
LTQLPSAPSDISWSPDGNTIAFSSLVESEPPKLAKPPKAPKEARWAPPAKIIDRLRYRADGQGYLKNGYNHIFVVPASGGTPRQLTSGDYHHGGRLSWSPDGSMITFAANRFDDYELRLDGSEIWAVTVANGTLEQLAERAGPDANPVFSPDGKQIAFQGTEDSRSSYRHADVYLLDVESGDVTRIEEDLDRSFSRVLWRDRNTLIVSFNDRGRTVIAELSKSGKITPLTDRVGGLGIGRPYTSGTFSVANNGAYAFNLAATDRPADVGYARGNSEPKQLTDLNGDLISQRTMSPIEQLTWMSVDDLEIEGWLAFPPDFDPAKKYPLILEIHGGPHTAYGPQFSTEIQLYAAAGYVVLYTNPRGSTSYGLEFAREIDRNYPSKDYDDLIAGVDAVIERGYIDERQLYVTGGSGGGVLTAWIVGKTDRFRAAVSAKPVINWISEALYADISAFTTQYWFDTPPWEDVNEYWRRSPLSLVGNVTTPTMLLTGEQDFRTPIVESEQYYQALKLRGIDTMLVRIPESSHSIYQRPSQLIAKVDNILAWFERYREKETSTDEETKP